MQSRGAYWRKLDNAAKLFSAASTKRDTRVFRFYCELREEIEEAKLQQALDRTLVKYPMFLSVMRKACSGIILNRVICARSFGKKPGNLAEICTSGTRKSFCLK